MTQTSEARRDLDWLVTSLWTVACLVLLDVAIGLVFRVPGDPRVPPGRVARYLDAGRSVEAKLRYMVSEHDTLATPVALAGWLDPAVRPAPRPLATGQRRLAVFGPSFALAIGDTLAERHPAEWVFEPQGGPAAPVSQSFALWRVERRRSHADAAVLGILASSLRGVDAASAATWMFESPYPYTYPRWRADGDSVVGEWPSITSCDSLRAALRSPARWNAYERELARNDAWFSAFLFRSGWMDGSVTLRLLRKAWAQRASRLHTERLHDRHGFRPGAEAIRTAGDLAIRFTREVRADGGVPVILLIEDRGYDDHLERALGERLSAAGVPWLSTHGIAPPGDPATFTADAHFRGDLNQRIADALIGEIRRQQGSLEPLAGPSPGAVGAGIPTNSSPGQIRH